MGKNSYYKSIITNYNHIVDVLMQKGIVKRQNSLSIKPESAKKLRIEYSTKNKTAQVLFDTSLSAVELYSRLLTNNQFNMLYVRTRQKRNPAGFAPTRRVFSC